jgi:hypothetical protein
MQDFISKLLNLNKPLFEYFCVYIKSYNIQEKRNKK